jgi:hypothetical protein
MMMGTGSSAKYVTLNNGTKLFYSCPNRVKESLTGREIKHLVNDDSDLLPGEYEGNLLIWPINYLNSRE